MAFTGKAGSFIEGKGRKNVPLGLFPLIQRFALPETYATPGAMRFFPGRLHLESFAANTDLAGSTLCACRANSSTTGTLNDQR